MEQLPSPEVQKMKEEQAKAAEEQREVILSTILSPAARERLARIALVKEAKAREIENNLIQMALKRQVSGKISEEQLIAMIENNTEKSQQSIKVIRRKGFDSDSDDLDDL